jgi:hypothetical protein
MNNSKTNLFERIHSCNYGPKFEYLIGRFESTVNLKESHQNELNRCHILPNISEQLDHKKQIFARLPEYLSKVAEEELVKYNLNACNVTYFPQMGFFFVIKEDNFQQSNNMSLNTINKLVIFLF